MRRVQHRRAGPRGDSESREREVLVHRKGATRAFGPGMADLPERFRPIGQPVIIGGGMETGSYPLGAWGMRRRPSSPRHTAVGER